MNDSHRVEVRQATNDDYVAMLPLLETWIAECNPDQYDFEPDAEVIRETLRTMAGTPIGETLVMLHDDKLIGVLGLVKHGWGATHRHTFVSENFWYVLPEFAGYARSMVRAAADWVESKDCKYLMFSTNRLSSERSKRSGAWLEALGFSALYELYIMEV